MIVLALSFRVVSNEVNAFFRDDIAARRKQNERNQFDVVVLLLFSFLFSAISLSRSVAPGRSESIFRFVHWLNLNPNTTCSKCAEKQQLQWFNVIVNTKSRSSSKRAQKRKNGKAISRQLVALLLLLSFYY